MKIETLTEIECHKLITFLLKGYGSEIKRVKAVRNCTMAVLMLDAGLRVGELVQLLVSDLIFNSQPVTSIIIRAEIAKKHRERYVPVSQRLAEGIKNLNECYWSHFGFFNSSYAFAFTNRHCSPSARQVQRIIKQASLQAIGRAIHPHALRHTFATRLMRITSIRVVQELLGHKNLSSTQIYTHPNSDDLQEAIKNIDKKNGGEA